MKQKEIAAHLSHLITEARVIGGLTQKQLADKMGTKQTNISRAEKGLQEPSVYFLYRVAKAVGVELVFPSFNP